VVQVVAAILAAPTPLRPRGVGTREVRGRYAEGGAERRGEERRGEERRRVGGGYNLENNILSGGMH